MCEVLAREGVLVAPGDCFEAPTHFRIGFGAQASGFQEALDIITHHGVDRSDIAFAGARRDALKAISSMSACVTAELAQELGKAIGAA